MEDFIKNELNKFKKKDEGINVEKPQVNPEDEKKFQKTIDFKNEMKMSKDSIKNLKANSEYSEQQSKFVSTGVDATKPTSAKFEIPKIEDSLIKQKIIEQLRENNKNIGVSKEKPKEKPFEINKKFEKETNSLNLKIEKNIPKDV